MENPIITMFKMQLELQQHLAKTGRAIDYIEASTEELVKDITIQWRNLTLEFAELLERLPYKEWKTYNRYELTYEEKLEVWYEYIDMFHFFLNIGLALGIDGVAFERLYITKNKENFDRQTRGY
jgi:dimeric dUTPase (all-alpha-NTP-PPase superfamily)